MPWVMLHESGYEYAFHSDGDATFVYSFVTQHDYSAFWYLAFPPGGIPAEVRITSLGWSGDFGVDPNIVTVSFGYSSEEGFITSPAEVEGEQANESEDKNSEWLPSPFVFSFVDPPAEYGIVQYRYWGEQETPQYAEWQIEVWQDGPEPPEECSYDCSCDPESGRRNTETLGTLTDRLLHRLGFLDPLTDPADVRTLADFRKNLLVRGGFAANATNPPAGMHDLIDAIVNDSQQLLWRRLELDQSGAAPPLMTSPSSPNVLDYNLIFPLALGQFKAHNNKQDAKLYLDQAEKQLADYMKRSPPSIRRIARDFLRESQRFLYDKVASFRQSRFFYWPLQQGVRFYDFAENEDACGKRFVPELVEGVYVTHGDDCATERWDCLRAGIDPLLYNGGVRESWPQRYEFRQCIELFPAPDDRPGFLRIKAKFDLQPFEEDEDHTTIDADLVFLHALSMAKKHFAQPDAKEYEALVQSKIGDIVAGSHHTRRYVPVDGEPCPNANPPRPRDGWLD